MIRRSFFIFLFFFPLYGQIHFKATYSQWRNPENYFVEYLYEKNQARVIFIGSKVFSSDGKGRQPSVSEGMGYGLLLSYANDDQHLFDKFLRYVLEACMKYGCVVFGKEKCHHKSFFLMPWMLDYQAEPFWYKPQKNSKQSYYSSGSATDADIQIAWALNLAHKKVQKGQWKNNYFLTAFGRADYNKIFRLMANEIRLYDIDWNKKIILPGSQWGEAGKNVFFAGYFTPQAFEVLDEAPFPDASDFPDEEEEKNSSAYLLSIKNNSSKRLFINELEGNGKIYPNTYLIKTNKSHLYWIPPLSTATILFFPEKDLSTLHIKISDDNEAEEMKADYTLLANNGKWEVDKLINSSKANHFTLRKDRIYISMTGKNFPLLKFSFLDVMTNSAKVIKTFQEKYNTGLVPNILYFDGKYPSSWEKAFSYDAIRFALWTTPYLYGNKKAKDYSLLEGILSKMMGEKGLLPFIKKIKKGWTLPPEGINVFTHKENNGWHGVSPALNAPVFLYSYFLKDEEMLKKLGPAIENYSIIKKQPSIFDPPNDSSAYYTACMLLIIHALIEEELQ